MSTNPTVDSNLIPTEEEKKDYSIDISSDFEMSISDTAADGKVARLKHKKPDIYADAVEVCDSVTREEIAHVSEFNEKFLGETVKVASNAAMQVFSDNPDVDMVNVKVPMGFNRGEYVEVPIRKETTRINVSTKLPTKRPSVKVRVHTPATTLSRKIIRGYEDAIAESIANG